MRLFRFVPQDTPLHALSFPVCDEIRNGSFPPLLRTCTFLISICGARRDKYITEKGKILPNCMAASKYKNLLSVPATSAAVERVFSQAGFVSGHKRYRLLGKNLEKEVLLRSNKIYLQYPFFSVSFVPRNRI